VAEQEEKSVSIPWLPLITLVGVGSGVLFLHFQQLTSSRPGGGDPRLASDTFDEQTVDARLWEDPLGVAIADQEKRKKENDTYSIGRFQKLLIEKCFPVSGSGSPASQSSFAEDKEHLEESARRLKVFAVMIPGGPYVEDVERRLRSRRAVIEALGIEGYHPERDHEIGYFNLPWPGVQSDVKRSVSVLERNRHEDERTSSGIALVRLAAGVSDLEKNRGEDQGRRLATDSLIVPARTNWKELDLHNYRETRLEVSENGGRANPQEPNGQPLIVPYEWCEPAVDPPENVAHILVLWLRDDAFRDAPLARLADLISWIRWKSRDGNLVLPDFSILGPDNSGTLHSMVLEANAAPWNDDTRKCLATTHFYSSQPAAAESQLLSDVHNRFGSCRDLIEQRIKHSEPGSGFSFQRTILLDDQIVKTMWQELRYRGLKCGDDVVIISEEDTYYARALSATFTNQDVIGTLPGNIYSYTYLRGVDGKLPSNGKDESEAKSTAANDGKNAPTTSRPTEQTEGVNQADDLRRLAKRLQSLDRNLWNKRGKGIKAVGLLGSDVYDKLELLKALRPMLPEAIFFTNNLEARLAHPDEWKETHNLVIVSAHDLSLEGPYLKYQQVAPFRDSGQTALFEATLMATKPVSFRKQYPDSPLIFEIGRNGPKKLSVSTHKSTTMPGMLRAVEGYFQRFLRILCALAIGSLLLAWIWLVSRVTIVPSPAKTADKK
jgi:hypothetical protein